MLLSTVIFPAPFPFLSNVIFLVIFLDPSASPFQLVLYWEKITIWGGCGKGDAIEIIFDQFLEELIHFIGNQIDPLNRLSLTEPEWL